MSVRWRHYVYVHIRRDTGRVFYVGKGSRRNRRPDSTYERAHCTDGRNQYWQNIVAKAGGFDVRIVASCIDNETACDVEVSLISEYGRDALCNMTDGGEGTCGLEASDALRRKRSINAQGERSQAWIDSIRKARKNGGNGGVVKHGDKLPESWRRNIAKSVTGSGNSMYGKIGKLHPLSRPVVDNETGRQFESVTEAARSSEYSFSYLHAMLTGIKPNKTTMVLQCL